MLPDPATIDLRSAEAALTAASERLAEVLRGRRDAPAHTGSGDVIELLLKLADTRDRLREVYAELARTVPDDPTPGQYLRLLGGKPSAVAPP